MAHDVFICHAASDQHVASVACAQLEAAGIRCWLDQRDVGPEMHAGQVVGAIEEAAVILLVFSEAADRSKHVLSELALARHRQKVIIPFKIQDAIPTGDLRFLTGDLPWLDALDQPLERRLDGVVDVVKRFLTNRSGGSVDAAPREAQTDAVEADRALERERKDDPTAHAQVFVSHVEEDQQLALTIVELLNAKGFRTWCYEHDNVPGLSYLLQTAEAISACDAFLLIISANSLSSHQINVEVERAFEDRKPFVPLRFGIAHNEFQVRNNLWRQAMGTTASIEIRNDNVEATVGRVIKGLRGLGITPMGEHLAKRERR